MRWFFLTQAPHGKIIFIILEILPYINAYMLLHFASFSLIFTCKKLIFTYKRPNYHFKIFQCHKRNSRKKQFKHAQIPTTTTYNPLMAEMLKTNSIYWIVHSRKEICVINIWNSVIVRLLYRILNTDFRKCLKQREKLEHWVEEEEGMEKGGKERGNVK